MREKVMRIISRRDTAFKLTFGNKQTYQDSELMEH